MSIARSWMPTARSPSHEADLRSSNRLLPSRVAGTDTTLGTKARRGGVRLLARAASLDLEPMAITAQTVTAMCHVEEGGIGATRSPHRLQPLFESKRNRSNIIRTAIATVRAGNRFIVIKRTSVFSPIKNPCLLIGIPNATHGDGFRARNLLTTTIKANPLDLFFVFHFLFS